MLGASALLVPSTAWADDPPLPPPSGQAPTALSDEVSVSRFAYAQKATEAHDGPSTNHRGVGRLRFLTSDGQIQPYLALQEETGPAGDPWIEVRLPKRPNGSTGWVPAGSLGGLHTVYGHLEVDRRKLRATLFDRSGRATWSAPVGVGRPSLPTPAGRFFVMEKLRAIGGPFYGPYAIGTSAFAPRLSEWPGGGVVGLHGTDQPKLVPGRPSHGCLRLHNADITGLWRRIHVGTPITIT